METARHNGVDLKNQIGIVTGATGGLGSAISRELAASGMNVVLVARAAVALDKLVRDIVSGGGQASAAVADVTDTRRAAEIVAEVEEQVGPVALLVNCAGAASPIGPFRDADADDWWRTVEVNLKGPAVWCRAILPAMTARGRGRIINVASGAGTVAIPYLSAYVTSKTALIRLTEVLAAEVSGAGVHVFAIEPGTVRTPMAERVLTSDAGRRWLPWFADIFTEGRDVRAEDSARFVLQLAAGAGDALRGRFVTLGDDLSALAAEIDVNPASNVLVLRVNRP